MKKIVLVILLLIMVTLFLVPPVLADNSAPTFTSISPTTGPTAGSTVVTIIGTGFTNATAVTFGGTPASSFTVTSDTQITATTPVYATAGPVNVVVTTPSGTATGTGAYTYTAAPTVTGIVPTSGTTAGSTVVTITGTGFIGATVVTFGGIAATPFTVNSATQITATTPAHTTAGPVDVIVTTPGGTSATSAADGYTYTAPIVPAVTGIVPTSGTTAGGTSVTITGTGFTGVTGVMFGSTAATITANTATSITVTAPAGAAGLVDITVTTPGGTSATSAVDGYTYTAALVPPVAAFIGTPTSGTAPLTVQFTGTSTGSPTSWSWVFGDGNSSTVQNPSFTYTIPGTWTVSLTATNSFGSNITTIAGYITVSSSTSAPVASFIGSPTLGTAPLTVQFNDTSSGSPTSWLWSFGDGSSSTDQNPSYTYVIPGSYTVSLTATNSVNSNISTYENYITVSQEVIQTQTPVPTLSTPIPTPTPQKVIAAFKGTPTSGNAPLIVQFTDSSTGSPTSWSWDFGDGGTSSQRNPSYTYTFPGDYTVILTVKNAGRGGVLTKTSYIAVNAAPTPSPISPLTTLGALGAAVMISTLLIGRKKH
jgi:PKD repeat protein